MPTTTEEFEEFRQWREEQNKKLSQKTQRRERNSSGLTTVTKKSTVLKAVVALSEGDVNVSVSITSIKFWIEHNFGWMRITQNVGNLLTSLVNDGLLEVIVEGSKHRSFKLTKNAKPYLSK